MSKETATKTRDYKYVGKKDVVDPKTGEVVTLFLYGKEPRALDTGYAKIFNVFLQDMISDPEIAGKAIRLLLWITTKINYNSLEIYLYHESVSKELNVSRATFYRWLNTLVDKGILKPIKGKPYWFRLKPYSVVRGLMSEARQLELFK